MAQVLRHDYGPFEPMAMIDPPAKDNSFQALFARLDEGESAPAREVFARFAGRLAAMVQSRMSPQLRAKIDPDDIVQSVFRTFFRRQHQAQFELHDWESLWSLLAQIAARKCSRWAEYFAAQKRGLARETPSCSLDVDAREPMPDEVVLLTELTDRLLNHFEGVDRTILELLLQGHSRREVSVLAQRTERTIDRVLQRVRNWLAREVAKT